MYTTNWTKNNFNPNLSVFNSKIICLTGDLDRLSYQVYIIVCKFTINFFKHILLKLKIFYPHTVVYFSLLAIDNSISLECEHRVTNRHIRIHIYIRTHPSNETHGNKKTVLLRRLLKEIIELLPCHIPLTTSRLQHRERPPHTNNSDPKRRISPFSTNKIEYKNTEYKVEIPLYCRIV